MADYCVNAMYTDDKDGEPIVESRPCKWESSTFTDVCTVCGYVVVYSNEKYGILELEE